MLAQFKSVVSYLIYEILAEGFIALLGLSYILDIWVVEK